ncbi:hypothetical protein [Planctomycetes bacterium CA13]|uniref:hypothetical protein n=1 Tax=Novipirellula herctigrandis TaxID=2527986 RepID=UPI0011B6C13E
MPTVHVCAAVSLFAVFACFPLPALAEDIGEQKIDTAQIALWVKQLGANKFAERESAAAHLADLGLDAIPVLQEASEQTADAEVRLRAGKLIRQLTEGDMRAHIEAFLAGKDVSFDGWNRVAMLMGDSIGVRELFVEIMLAHPEVTKSLAGASRDRYVAMEVAVGRVSSRMYEQFQPATRADIVALLLPAIDAAVPVSESNESLLLSILRQSEGSRLHRDMQLSGPIDELVGIWVNRSSLANREEMIFFAMNWQLPSVLPIAEKTLVESTAANTIATALQAISQYGDRDDTELVAHFLDDTRLIASQSIVAGDISETMIGDAAMITIARLLYNGPITEMGFPSDEKHPLQGFILEEIGYSKANPDDRKAIRKRIDELVDAERKRRAGELDQS